MKRTTAYTLVDEETTQISIRLPTSVLARLDAERGEISRAAWIASRLYPSVTVSGGMMRTPEPVDPFVEQCLHTKKVRGASGLNRCAECGTIQT